MVTFYLLTSGCRGTKLNDIGRVKGDPDDKNGNMLKWKRAAERYLMKHSLFTILHAAQFTEEKGGTKEIIWDTDDALLRNNFRKISTDDAAEVVVQALIWKQAIGRSIDIANKPVDASSPAVMSDITNDHVDSHSDSATHKRPPMDWLHFWSIPGDCRYPSEYKESESRK